MPTRHRCTKHEQVKEIKCYYGENIILVHYAFILGHICYVFTRGIGLYEQVLLSYNSKSLHFFFPRPMYFALKL